MTARTLLAGWRIQADALPEHMAAGDAAPAFSLPGEQELLAYADLLDAQDAPAQRAAPASAPFALPALLPEDVPGAVTLSREIDFGALRGDHAVLELDRLLGRGEVRLGDEVIAVFPGDAQESAPAAAPCQLAVDLSGALRRGRRETLSLCFGEERPAGVPGPVLLRVTQYARFAQVSVLPDAAQRTMTVRVRIAAGDEGTYVLRAQPAPAVAQEAALPAREIALPPGRPGELTLAVPGERFTPGVPYAAPVLKLQLLRRVARPGARLSGGGSLPQSVLCDSVTLMCGYPSASAPAWVPLTAAQCAGDAQALAERLGALHLCAVSAPLPAQDDFYRSMTRTGVSVRLAAPAKHPLRERLSRHACVCFSDAPDLPVSDDPAQSAWRLCGMVGSTRAAELAPAELLAEAAGRSVDPDEPGAAAVLSWLRAVEVRLRAEAARQGRFVGALCAPGLWAEPDIADALSTAMRPTHLSALPLLGAWWTCTRFSASLVAFVSNDAQGEPLEAQAILEDEHGHVLARVEAACPPRGGYVGLIEARLPDAPCVLELTCRLLRDGEVVEHSTLPVYVGERGPLEAAF
ncbi:MAG: hypothetical protein ACI4PG_13045 [Candidatus Ventricola sp.]